LNLGAPGFGFPDRLVNSSCSCTCRVVHSAHSGGSAKCAYDNQRTQTFGQMASLTANNRATVAKRARPVTPIEWATQHLNLHLWRLRFLATSCSDGSWRSPRWQTHELDARKLRRRASYSNGPCDTPTPSLSC
jgi:hypothetical protein